MQCTRTPHRSNEITDIARHLDGGGGVAAAAVPACRHPVLLHLAAFLPPLSPDQ